ncbi:MAG: hypothetical protein VX764_10680 [Planctomycetota bacterium]|nr:hypothetical protein [Planctomycetota bacterium]
MKLPGTNLLLLLLLLLSWLVGDAVEAQTPTSDYAFFLVPSVPNCTAGDEVTIDLYLQILPSAPIATPLEGFSVGICHNTAILGLSTGIPSPLVMGSWITSLVPCIAPDFLQTAVLGGATESAGYTIGTVFSFTGGCTLPVGCHHIATAEYSCLIDAPIDGSVISTCNTLGSPPMNTVVILGGNQYTPQSEFISDEIPVECSYPAPGQMQLDWTNSGVFDSFEIVCDGVVVASLPGSDTSYTHFCDPDSTVCCTVVGTVCGITVESEPCCCVPAGPCLEFEEDYSIECDPDGEGHILTFQFINLSGLTVHKVVIPGEIATTSGTATVSDNVIVFVPGIANGDLVNISVPISGAMGGDLLTLPFALMHKNDDGSVVECCSDEIIIEVPPCEQEFIRCDNNRDGGCDIGDAIFLLTFLFLNGAPCSCLDACDCNDDGVIDLGDVIFKLSFLFIGGPPPPSPWPQCGIDPTPDNLDCLSFPPCP